MKKLILFGFLILMVMGCQKNNYQQINVEAAKEKMKNGAYLVDVRSNTEYQKYHIKGAINIPVDEIQNPQNKIISKNDVIIVYCQSGVRSKEAAKKLLQIGYMHVYDLGSINNWK